ncbi:putative NAD/FAD-dependent oxidoreductase [Xenococcus sp. PCC 7305]|uniref:NAD(P)/FAD-dependent oxidoreductase n=1 Tax=Xenococcus sp. PCC 7305 TaxID=102125 RepID=UPI0002AD06B0|nr:FAD-dependent oxidoreductase [Xenococcus sp. PCC 7305]ELS03026.1 putative NAD/FAD-dependent oxidoreductase [Xenococcus sp. PCC 7305]
MSINHQQQRNTKSPYCLIIGGGISGLIIATELKRHGIASTILDKGRGIGGRLATRRIEHSEAVEGIFDYGAQHFTVSDPKFQVWVDEWLKKDIVEAWNKGFPSVDGNIQQENQVYYRGVVSNRNIAKYLSQELDVHTSTKIINLNRQNSQWNLEADNGANFVGDILIMTAPIPQSLALLDSSHISLAPEIRDRLEQIVYHKCIAILALLDKPSKIPKPGGLFLDGKPLAWIASNHHKGISPQGYAVTLHGSAEFSEAHWETDQANLANQLFTAASPWLDANVTRYQVHRWRYSQPQTFYGEPYLVLPGLRLILAGDAFISPNIEGAVLSGLAAVEYLLSQN